MAKGSEMSDTRLGVDSLWARCFWEPDMRLRLRLELLRRGLAEYGSPSFCGRVRVERSIGGGGGSGESETERLGQAAAAGGGRGMLDFLTWTEDG